MKKTMTILSLLVASLGVHADTNNQELGLNAPLLSVFSRGKKITLKTDIVLNSSNSELPMYSSLADKSCERNRNILSADNCTVIVSDHSLTQLRAGTALIVDSTIDVAKELAAAGVNLDRSIPGIEAHIEGTNQSVRIICDAYSQQFINDQGQVIFQLFSNSLGEKIKMEPFEHFENLRAQGIANSQAQCQGQVEKDDLDRLKKLYPAARPLNWFDVFNAPESAWALWGSARIY